MASKFTVVLLLCVMVVVNRAEDVVNFGCPNDWYAYNDNCYHFNTERRFNSASGSSYCTERGAKLLYITSIEEFKFAGAIASSRNSDVLLPSLHIGLNDNAREGDFVWSNGNKLADAPNVVNWEPNQPNDRYHNQNCVVYRINNGNINDAPCSYTAGVFCKKARE